MEVQGRRSSTATCSPSTSSGAEHPSDDLMTALLNAEFEDERRHDAPLTRHEVLTYTEVLAGAGNETTGRLIGWLGKVLAEHPDQRRELVDEPLAGPDAIEETLRFEPTGPHSPATSTTTSSTTARRSRQGSAMLLLVGSANRDERRTTRTASTSTARRPHLASAARLPTAWLQPGPPQGVASPSTSCSPGSRMDAPRPPPPGAHDAQGLHHLHRDHPRPRGHEGLQRGRGQGLRRRTIPLAVDRSPEVLEGEWPVTQTVLLEFESPEAARAWYESDAYQAAVPLRQAAADTDVAILHGF